MMCEITHAVVYFSLNACSHACKYCDFQCSALRNDRLLSRYSCAGVVFVFVVDLSLEEVIVPVIALVPSAQLAALRKKRDMDGQYARNLKTLAPQAGIT